MKLHRVMIAALAGALLAACAEEPGPSRSSYGPPTPRLSPATGMESFKGMSGWAPTNEHYRSATPPPFKGF